MSNTGSSFDILPPNEQSVTVYGELNLNVGQLITSAFNVAFVRLIVKFWGQSKGILMISSNGDPTGNLTNQQKYLIKTSLPQFKKYLQDGYLMIEVVDKRNANLIGSCQVYFMQFIQSTKPDTLLDFNQEFMVYRNNASVELTSIGTLKIGATCTFFIFPPDLSPIKQKKSILPPKFEHAIDDSDHQPESSDVDHLPTYQEARQLKKVPQEVLSIPKVVEPKVEERKYINTQEQLELELLRLEDDAALLFGITKPQSYSQVPAKEIPTITEITNQHQNFSYREVSSLTVQIIKFTMVGDKQRKSLGDRPVVVECRVPVLKTGVVSYQSFEVWDSDRNGQNLYFGGQFQSPLQVNEQNWSQINQFIIKFKVQTPQDLPAPIELGLGEFQLSQMLIDGLRNFTYEIDITQLRSDKKKPEKVVVGTLSIKVSLGPGEQQQIAKQKKNEDDIDILRKDLETQIQQYKQELEAAKQQTQMNLADELQNMQLFLYVERVQEMPQPYLWNLQVKCKPYGLGKVDKLESDIHWRKNRPYFAFKIINPINIENIQKMEFLQWVIEIWNHSVDQQPQLTGLCRLSLQQIHSGVFTSASPITYIQYLKTNLHPLVVYDSDMPIEDIRDRSLIGVIHLKLAFGTPQQIIRFENQLNKQQIEEESEQQSEQQPQQEEENPTEEIEQPIEPQMKETTGEFIQPPSNMRLVTALIIVLNQILERPVHIPLIPKKSFIPRELCQTLLQQLTSKLVDPIAIEVVAYHLYDPIQQLVNWGHFLDSWVAFQSYRNWTKDEFTQIYQSFYSQAIRSGAFENISQMEKYLNIQQALFGYGDIDFAKELLNQVVVPSTRKKATIPPELIDNIFKTLEINAENQVFLPTLFENLRQIEIFGEIRQFQMTESTLIQAVEEKIIVWVQDPNNQQHANEFQVTRSGLTQNVITPPDLIFLFDSMSLSISLLDALVICESIQRKHLIESQQIPELIFWRYLSDLSAIQPKEEPPQIQDEIEEIAYLLDRQDRSPPKQIKKQEKQVEPIFDEIYRHVLSIELSQMINYSLPQSLYKIQIALITGSKSLKADSNSFNDDDNLRLMTQFTIFTKQTEDTPIVEQALQQRLQDNSVIFILFDVKNQKLVAKGALPCEEILSLKEDSTGIRYISLFSTEEVVRLQLKVSHKTIIVTLLGEDECKMISSEGQIRQIGPVLSESEIIKKIQLETTTIFKLQLQQIFFVRPFLSRSDLYHVEIEIQEEQLKKAIPDFQSDQIPTRVAQDVQHLQFDVDYDITCEDLMFNLIARSELKIRVKYFFMEEVSYQLQGKLPFIGLFEDGLLEGDIPLFNDQEILIATLSLRAEMKNQNDQVFHQEEQIIPESQSRSKYFLRIVDLIIFQLDGKTELGEIYFSIREPYQQSESYEISGIQVARVNIHSCVFELTEEPSLTTIEVRSLFLGEDRLLGHFNIQTHTIINELINEMNYLIIQPEDWANGTTMRVGAKIISINYDEDSLNQESLNKLLGAFKPEHMQQIGQIVNRIDNDLVDSVRGYLRLQLGFSFSEISFLFNLIQKDLTTTLKNLFTEQIYEYDENFTQLLGNRLPHNLIFDLSAEFKFYDKFHTGFIDPKHLGTILGYFQIDSKQQNINQYLQNFIPFYLKDRMKDLGLHDLRSQFDYVCFLVFLQMHLKVRPYFQDIDILSRARQNFTPKKNYIESPPMKISPQKNVHFSPRQEISKIEERNYDFFIRDGQQIEKVLEPQQPKIKEIQENIIPTKTIYSSSKGSSSKPTIKEKTESNGTVQQLDDKVQDTYKSYEYIRRIEEIIRRNNLNILQDDLSSSDESLDEQF